MARTLQQYRDLLLALLPQGDAWNTEPGSQLGLLMTGLAEEYARIEARGEDLLKESDPSRTLELLSEWEIDYGLPEICPHDDQHPNLVAETVAERRDWLVAKVAMLGSQSRQFFIALAASYGHTMTITEYAAGDSIPGHAEIATSDAAFVVQLNLPAVSETTRFRAGSVAGDRLRTWGTPDALECLLSRLFHAHQTLIFTYG